MGDSHSLEPERATTTSTSRRLGRRLRVVLVLAGILAAAGWSWAPGRALAAPSAAASTQTKYHFFPSLTYAKTTRTACFTDCTLMTYHGGPVQHAQVTYMIFWQPAGRYMPPSYRSGLSTWLSEVAAGDFTAANPYSVAQQYYDNSGPGATHNFVSYGVINAGTIIATDALPASGCTDKDGATTLPVCLNDTQLRAEIQKVVTAHSLPQNTNTDYLLFTPKNVGSCFDSGSTSCAYSNYCAYHSFFTGTGGQIVYSNMPWTYMTSGCDVNTVFGTGYANGSAIDPEVGVTSHEMIETMTDPNINAWYSGSVNEIGDKCAYIYGNGGIGSMTGLTNNGLGYWNVSLSGDEYLMQLEFSNRNSNGTTSGCVRMDTDTQPVFTVAVSPPSPTHGVSATFTANFTTNPFGTSKITWNFGDGIVSTVFASNTTNHTYATAGTKTLTTIVTDNHGNEKKVVQTVTVS